MTSKSYKQYSILMFSSCKNYYMNKDVEEPVKIPTSEEKKTHIQEVVNNALDMLKFKGTREENRQVAHAYADAVGMDEFNRNALKVLKMQNEKSFIKHVFTDQTNSEKQMSYAEMRVRYG